MLQSTATSVAVVLLLLVVVACGQCPSQCDCAGTAVYCYSKGLTAIPSGVPETTTYLDLRYNQISSIQDGTFSELKLGSLTSLLLDSNQLTEVRVGTFTGLPLLRALRLQNNQISVIDDEAFAGLPRLSYLELYGNNLVKISRDLLSGLSSLSNFRACCMSTLTVIEDGAFSHVGSLLYLRLESNGLEVPALDFRLSFLPRLVSLNLYNNKINSLTTGAFGGLSSLTYLNISSNLLSSLPDGSFSGLSSLVTLGLGRNMLSSFPSMDPIQTTLSTLDMRFNSLTEIPSNVFKDMSSLTLLHLEGNQISTLWDDSFTGPTHLRTLHLNSNLLKVYPPLERVAESLEYLYLSNNLISDISTTSFRSYSNLRYLELTNNNFSSFPSDNFGTAPLQYLFVSHNRLAALSRHLVHNLTQLEHFHASHNLLTQLDNGTFVGLPKLQHLHLGHNQLRNISPMSMSNLTNLRRIYLNNNFLSRLDRGILNASSLLQLIYLDYNKLTELDSNTFSGFSMLQYLRLQYNLLTELHEDLFAGLSALEQLNLRGNRLKSLPVSLFRDTHNLRLLHLLSNQLSVLPQGLFGGLFHPTSIYAYYNPFVCSCNLLWFYNFVHENSLPYSGAYRCSEPSELNSMSFGVLHGDNFTCVLPTFTVTPADATVTEGKSLVLSCAADGFPEPTITWYKDGDVVSWHTQLEAGSLFIDTVDITDEGRYECVAVNTAENEIRSLIIVTVQAFCINGECVNVEAVYRDFRMDSTSSPDFSLSSLRSGLTLDLVSTTLGPGSLPTLRNSTTSVLTDFSSWFTDIANINKQYSGSLRLDRDGSVYVFQSNSFFPMDNRGFFNNSASDLKDCNEEVHNFGFTSILRSAFRYQGNEQLVVHGNDDIWVFVDRSLVIDIGGTHQPLCQGVTLSGNRTIERSEGLGFDPTVPACIDQSGLEFVPLSLKKDLVVGQFYRFDVFHAQRHSCIDLCPNCTSSLYIATTIQSSNFANQLLSVEVDEATNITDPVGIININDYNVVFEGVQNFTFSVVEGNDDEKFTIDNSTGEIRLLAALDYEEAPEYMLVVQVASAADPSKTAIVAVAVEVIDLNDNAPTVTPRYAEVDISEMEVGGHPVVDFVVEDTDSGNNGQLVVSIADVSSDRVGKEKYEFTVVVSVTDLGTPPKSTESTIVVSGAAVCEGSSFVIDQSTFQLKYVSSGYFLDKVNGVCIPCIAGYYCPGDGSRQKCGCARNDSSCHNVPSEYSNGLAVECSPCPEGWICTNGHAEPCKNGFYADPCSDQECQEACLPCPAGSICLSGKATPCKPGTFEEGNVRCTPCPRGFYSNGTSNRRCRCCSTGYHSSHSKDDCVPCRENEWSTGDPDAECGVCRTCERNGNCSCRSKPCFPGVHCVNLVGETPSFKCLQCPLGYDGNGIECLDVDECEQASPCSDTTQCINTSPGYMCTACQQGYTGHVPHGIGLEHALQIKQVCEDIDECEANNGGCDVHSTCINEPGTYSCSTCEPGYIGNGYTGCFPGDFCELGTHSCHENAVCTTTGLGQFECKCKTGFTGNGAYCGKDSDLDGFPDKRLFCVDRLCYKDNCKDEPNSGQENVDSDAFGDACDDDIDDDGWSNFQDNCPYTYNADQVDFDGDGVGDICDNCWNYTDPLRAGNDTRNPLQLDTDRDGLGDMCEHDRDGDGVADDVDNCEFTYNPRNQSDLDGDGVGDACDNCVNTSNPRSQNGVQTDSDHDFIGDACDNNIDSDHDGVQDDMDNCASDANSDQLDVDGDGIGNTCDSDTDGDGLEDIADNCPVVSNADQSDSDGDGKGDACQDDFDGDSVKDTEDNCPANHLISRTNFTLYLNTSIDFNPSTAPEWIITDEGAEVTQRQSTSPSFLLTTMGFEGLDFSGTFFVNTDNDDDLIGVVFGYQDFAHFYVVTWKGRSETYFQHACWWAVATGLSVKKIDSTLTNERCLRNAIWDSSSLRYPWRTGPFQTQALFTRDVSWKHRTAYKFRITHRPTVGLIRVVIEDENGTVADTGELFDFRFAGGKIGLLSFSQEHVIWSNLEYSCAERINHALEFDGIDDSVDLPKASSLGLDQSFTFDAWIRLPQNCCEGSLPVVCSREGLLCLFIKDSILQGVMSGKIVTSSERLMGSEWNHVGLRFEATEAVLSLLLNGTVVSTTTNVQTYQGRERMYLARDNKLQFFKGHVEELRFWSVALSDGDIARYHVTTSLSGAQTRERLRAHFDMNAGSGPTLYDQSRNDLNGLLYGGPKWVGSSLNFASLENHNLRRRKRDVAKQSNGGRKDEL